MKRSTKLIIVVLAIVILLPVIFIGIMATKLPSIGDVVNKVLKSTGNVEYTYNMKITSPDGTTVPDCYLLITTYSGTVDSLSSVNFVDPAMGVDAVLKGDSILLVLNNVTDLTADGLCLTVEIPENAKIQIENSVPTTDVRVISADIAAIKFLSLGSFFAEGTSLGAFLSSDTTYTSELKFENSNVGALKLNGANNSLVITGSNVGAITIAGTCNAIEMSDSNIGVCSWNKANSTMAKINNSSIVTNVSEDVVDITIGDNNNNDDNGSDIVNISPSRVLVESDGEKVDISPAGVFVNSEDTKVEISPKGVVVKENGEEVVNVGVGGVKVK